jgi:Lon-like ATP-dependent protease
VAKVEAAFQAGATKVYIPKENWNALFANLQGGLEVIPVDHIDELFGQLFEIKRDHVTQTVPTLAGDAHAPAVSILHADSKKE